MTPFRRLTLDGLRMMISDMRKTGVDVTGVVVNPIDHNDLAAEVMALAGETNPRANYRTDVIMLSGARVVKDARQDRYRATVMHRISRTEHDIAKVI